MKIFLKFNFAENSVYFSQFLVVVLAFLRGNFSLLTKQVSEIIIGKAKTSKSLHFRDFIRSNWHVISIFVIFVCHVEYRSSSTLKQLAIENVFLGSFLLIPPHQFNSPPVKRSSEIITELIVTTNQIAVFYNSNCN